ncbi:uncharacterized protein LOC131072842 [Cryptomeria japonica]|uniref:uncharacterized protein LOC131072842 n=1 Tax=Cryptomeria japonica TaxID=3369 RepID=UPI0027DA4E0A|nr:uncharacterized protein LOC131072842 [Cryptomeria japonica]
MPTNSKLLIPRPPVLAKHSKEKEGARPTHPHLQTHFREEKQSLFFGTSFPKVNKPESEMKPSDYDLHAIGVNLLNAMTSNKVKMMEEILKAISSNFIKKSRCLEKTQAKNAKLRESLTQQRKEDKALRVEINQLQGLLTQANTEKGKLQSALNNLGTHLKESKSSFKAKSRENETSLELAEKKLQDVEVLLRQEKDDVAQLQQEVQDGNVKTHALESQVIAEQNRCRELQGEVKQYCPSLQPMLRFLNDAQSLRTKASALIRSSMLVIGPKLSMAWDLVHLLHSAQDEELKEKGIVDHLQLIRRMNVFINRHREIMQALEALAPLQFSVPDIKQHIERLFLLGLPSHFPTDGIVLGIEQILSQIEHLQQDRTFLQGLGNPISADEVERLLHPLAQLSTLLKLVQDELTSLPFDEVICLEQHFQNLEAQVFPPKDEWFQIQQTFDSLHSVLP